MKEKDDILQQGLNASLKLFEVLQQMIDLSVNNCLQNTPEQLIELSHRLSEIETKQQQSLYDSTAIKQQLENLTATNKLLENAGETTQLLGQQHYDEHIIQPMLRSLFPVLDFIADARKHWKRSPKTAELLSVIWSQMEQFLAIYDVHIIEHATDDKFNPKIMRPIARTSTPDSQLDDCIAESLQMGFRYGPDRMLRLETVALFSYQPEETNSITLTEGETKC